MIETAKGGLGIDTLTATF